MSQISIDRRGQELVSGFESGSKLALGLLGLQQQQQNRQLQERYLRVQQGQVEAAESKALALSKQHALENALEEKRIEVSSRHAGVAERRISLDERKGDIEITMLQKELDRVRQEVALFEDAELPPMVAAGVVRDSLDTFFTTKDIGTREAQVGRLRMAGAYGNKLADILEPQVKNITMTRSEAEGTAFNQSSEAFRAAALGTEYAKTSELLAAYANAALAQEIGRIDSKAGDPEVEAMMKGLRATLGPALQRLDVLMGLEKAKTGDDTDGGEGPGSSSPAKEISNVEAYNSFRLREGKTPTAAELRAEKARMSKE